MKTSFCSIAFRKSPQNITDIIPIIANMGYDAIEIWGNHFLDLRLEDIRDSLRENDLRAAMVSPYLDFTGGPEKRNESIAIAEDFTEKALAVGSPNIRVFTGVVGSAEASDEQWRCAVSALKRICGSAAGTGINFALETHPKTLVDTVDSTLRLIDAVGADNLRVNLDIYHLWEIHHDPLWVFDQLKPFVCHVHAKNADLPPSSSSNHPLLHDRQASQEIYGVTYLDEGKMSYPEFIFELKKYGFDGYISVEWFGDNVIEAAEHELSYLSELYSNPVSGRMAKKNSSI